MTADHDEASIAILDARYRSTKGFVHRDMEDFKDPIRADEVNHPCRRRRCRCISLGIARQDDGCAEIRPIQRLSISLDVARSPSATAFLDEVEDFMSPRTQPTRTLLSMNCTRDSIAMLVCHPKMEHYVLD